MKPEMRFYVTTGKLSSFTQVQVYVWTRRKGLLVKMETYPYFIKSEYTLPELLKTGEARLATSKESEEMNIRFGYLFGD